MLKIRVQINSPMEEVFRFKCLTAQDMNLEITVTNEGPEVVTLMSYCDMESPEGTERIDYLYPQGPQTVAPGDSIGFYCFMDERRFKSFLKLAVYDSQGKQYTATSD